MYFYASILCDRDWDVFKRKISHLILPKNILSFNSHRALIRPVKNMQRQCDTMQGKGKWSVATRH